MFAHTCVPPQTGFNTLISLYMLQQYSARMEASPPNTGAGGTTPDYLFMLLIIGGAQLLSAPLVGMVFFGSSLYFGVLYVWCKINSTQQVAIWGFPMKAGMFPFALIALHLATGSDYMSDIVGLVSGHLYYFLVEVSARTHADGSRAWRRYELVSQSRSFVSRRSICERWVQERAGCERITERAQNERRVNAGFRVRVLAR